jgi:hypothetical protein
MGTFTFEESKAAPPLVRKLSLSQTVFMSLDWLLRTFLWIACATPGTSAFSSCSISLTGEV